MQFQAIKAGSARRRTACAIVGVHEGAALADAGRRLDRAAGGAISRLLRRGDFTGKNAETFPLTSLRRGPAERILLVGLGPRASYGRKAYRRAVFAAMDTPWFRCGQIFSDLLLEDVEFCFRAKAAGIQPFVDCGLRIGHIGGGVIWPGRDGRPWMQWHGGKYDRTEPCEDIPSEALGVEAWR